MKIYRDRLANGIPVLLAPDRNNSFFTIVCAVHGGSHYEEAHVSGISHLLEHMMFMTLKHKQRGSLEEVIEGVGAESNAETLEETITSFIKAPADAFEEMVELIAEQIKHPYITQKSLELEKNVVLHEMYLDDSGPNEIAFGVLPELIYGDQAAGRKISGTADTIKNITRDQLIALHRALFNTKNLVIVCSGNIPTKRKTMRILSQNFADVRGGVRPTKQEIWVPNRIVPPVRVFTMDLPQTFFLLSLDAPTFGSKHYETLLVLSVILGGASSSRLYKEIRQRRGWSYGVYSEPYLGKDLGLLHIHGGVHNEYLAEVFTVVVQQLNLLCIEEVAPGELKRAKQLLRSGVYEELSESSAVAHSIAEEALLMGRVRSYGAFLSGIDRVDSRAIQRLARKIFRSINCGAVVAGPHKSAVAEKIRNTLSELDE